MTSEKDGTFACKVKDCGKSFHNPQGLGAHVRFVHGGKKKSYKKRQNGTPLVSVALNFCSNCGHRLPNAVVMK